MRVVVFGQLQQSTWEDKGQKRSKVQVVAEAVGPDLRFHVATVLDASHTTQHTPVPPSPVGYPEGGWSDPVGPAEAIKQTLTPCLYNGEPF